MFFYNNEVFLILFGIKYKNIHNIYWYSSTRSVDSGSFSATHQATEMPYEHGIIFSDSSKSGSISVSLRKKKTGAVKAPTEKQMIAKVGFLQNCQLKNK